MDVAKYRKFLVALGAAVAVAISLTADGEISVNDLFGTGSAFVGALVLRQVPNAPPVE